MHRRDVGRSFRVIAENTTERSDGLVHRVLGDDHPGPGLVEKVVNTDNLACSLCEAKKESHRPRLYAHDLIATRNLVGGWIDAPSADAKGYCGWAIHEAIL
jgi:hypothetical protein